MSLGGRVVALAALAGMLASPGAAQAVGSGEGNGPHGEGAKDGSVRHPPHATITAPAEGSTYRDGVPVVLRGLASDEDGGDGELEDVTLSWRIVRHTGRNFEVVADLTGAEASFTPSDRWGADTTYQVRLTVTDDSGLSHTESLMIVPETVTVTLRSEPADAPLELGGAAQAGTRVVEDAVGHRVLLSAPETYTPAGGQELVFDGWSDGGERSREFIVPDASVELVARYRAPRIEAGEGQVEVSAGGWTDEVIRGDTSTLPALSLDAPNPFTLRVIAGWLRRAPGTPRVQVALRRGGSRAGCSWWTVRRTRFTTASRASCGRPRFIAATVRRTASGWRWRVALGRPLPAGTYSFVVRVLDSAGRPVDFVRG